VGGCSLRIHTDERRSAFCDLFDQPDGDTNLFIVHPGQRTCWHRHHRQTDQFRCIRGRVWVQTVGVDGDRTSHLLEDVGQRLAVHPGLWHGYENVGTEPAYLLMWLDQKYDPSDEQRLSEAEMPWTVIGRPRPIWRCVEGGSGADSLPDYAL
jgi:dTDP-4-dehydrorhamnose 3,5-epimerase-like enzyme